MSEITKSATREVTADAIAEANRRTFDENSLAAINSFSDAMSVIEETYGAADDFGNYGSGFEILEDKSSLLKVPFVILEWRHTRGDMGEFVSVSLVTQDGRKLILNDGSTGIRDQLAAIRDRRIAEGQTNPQGNLLVRNGLRVSEYKFVDPKTGDERPAKTFYLS